MVRMMYVEQKNNVTTTAPTNHPNSSPHNLRGTKSRARESPCKPGLKLHSFLKGIIEKAFGLRILQELTKRI